MSETTMYGCEVSEARAASLARAAELGADAAVLQTLAGALRLRQKSVIILPAHRYECLSRGRGWCRQGTGDRAVWGERVDGGYEVGPGRWTVGATDGFARKDSVGWTVRHVQVGPETWTVAD